MVVSKLKFGEKSEIKLSSAELVELACYNSDTVVIN